MLETIIARYRGAGGEAVLQPTPVGARRNAPLMRALEDAGDSGLTLEEVVAAAKRVGLGARRATVRSFLWNHVRAGRLVLSGDRYVAATYAGDAVSLVHEASAQ